MRGPVTTATAFFCAAALLCAVLAGDAQEPQPARLTFDVVSVKRTGPDAGASIVGGGRGQYTAINVPLRVPCNQRAFFGPQGATINSRGLTLERIAATLGTYADRTVVNKTGLTGEYDMLLKFRPEAGGPMGGLAPPLSTTAEPSSDLATLGIAVREQLGLKLEPARGPVQVLVIDSISPPTED